MKTINTNFIRGTKATLSCMLALATLSCATPETPPEIYVESMIMEIPAGQTTFVEELMPHEVVGTTITHVGVVGPTTETINFSADSVNMFVVIKGNATLMVGDQSFDLVPESLAIPIQYTSMVIDIEEGEELHYVHFARLITEEDRESIADFPAENIYDIYYTKFIDCEPYTEPIKSPNTVSRTVLHGDIVPRTALGTVGAPGPDKVGEHSHPMLDQLFLGLANNDIIVHADGASARLPEFSLLHIPLGSFHSVTVEENKTMYYLWMDFFMDRAGQEWLKTHNPITKDDL